MNHFWLLKVYHPYLICAIKDCQVRVENFLTPQRLNDEGCLPLSKVFTQEMDSMGPVFQVLTCNSVVLSNRNRLKERVN